MSTGFYYSIENLVLWTRSEITGFVLYRPGANPHKSRRTGAKLYLAGTPLQDMVGLFHCGNTDPRRLADPSMNYQVIMKRLMEPEGEPDITRGTIEGRIAASPITVLQVHRSGDGIHAYIIEGEFLDLDPKTFGCTGTAYLPGFRRFYRHILLGRFHHHAAIAFDHCGGILYEAFKLLGVPMIFTPLKEKPLYPGENPFETVS
jgi:L-fucose isomerase-like protein